MAKKIMPPFYFFTLLILSIGIYFFLPTVKFIFFPHILLGLIFIAFGIIMNLWADSVLKKKQTTVKPHEIPIFLVTFGPYRLSRHPMYLGMASILFGLAILLGSLISFLFPIIFIILMEKLFIPVEENNMKKQFGKKYLEYMRKVRRWI
jgi:protein-S-isoprenylcysteine O-methyltransferase Ste14